MGGRGAEIRRAPMPVGRPRCAPTMVGGATRGSHICFSALRFSMDTRAGFLIAKAPCMVRPGMFFLL